MLEAEYLACFNASFQDIWLRVIISHPGVIIYTGKPNNPFENFVKVKLLQDFPTEIGAQVEARTWKFLAAK